MLDTMTCASEIQWSLASLRAHACPACAFTSIRVPDQSEVPTLLVTREAMAWPAQAQQQAQQTEPVAGCVRQRGYHLEQLIGGARPHVADKVEGVRGVVDHLHAQHDHPSVYKVPT